MNEDLASQLSSILKKNNIDLNQVLENFNQSQKSEENSSENNNPPNENFSSIDPDMIIKIQKLLSLVNSNKKFKRRTTFKITKTLYERI